MVITIDGPAGAGKSAVAACASKRTNFLHITSGYFYRSVSKVLFDKGRNPEKQDDVIKTAKECQFTLCDDTLFVNGLPVSENIHSDLIDKWSSIHSCIPEVRNIINRALKLLSANRNIIVDGRDMSTVVFPDAEIKIYLDASLEIRSLRRFQQGVSNLSLEAIKEELKERDNRDKNKPVGSLIRSSDAQYIDTSDLTIEEVCERVVGEIHNKANLSGVNHKS